MRVFKGPSKDKSDLSRGEQFAGANGNFHKSPDKILLNIAVNCRAI